jgi:hypothetical protein
LIGLLPSERYLFVSLEEPCQAHSVWWTQEKWTSRKTTKMLLRG